MAYELGEGYIKLTLKSTPMMIGLKGVKLALSGFSFALGGLKKILGGVWHIAASVFSEIYKWLKRIALAAAGLFTYSIYQAAKQEETNIALAESLKQVNQYSQQNFDILRKQASEIQAATGYGDAYVMTLMRIALQLGITADQAGEAAKMALSFSAAFKGTGRATPEYLLRAYAAAVGGNTAALTSFIPELRKTKNENEKLAIVQKKAAELYQVLVARGQTFTSTLRRLKAVIGDTAEAFGMAFLPMLKRAMEKMMDWLKRNEQRFAEWGERVAATVQFVVDVFAELIRWLRHDWLANLKTLLDAVLELFKGFGAALKILMKSVWNDLLRDLRAEWAGFMGELRWDIENWSLIMAARTLGKNPFAEMTLAAARWQAGRKAEQRFREEHLATPFEQTIKKMGKVLDDAWDKAWGKLPDELKCSLESVFQKYKEALAAIGKRLPGAPGAPRIPQPAAIPISKIGFVGIEEAWKTFAGQLKPVEERMLDVEEDILGEAQTTNKLLSDMSTQIGNLGFMGVAP